MLRAHPFQGPKPYPGPIQAVGQSLPRAHTSRGSIGAHPCSGLIHAEQGPRNLTIMAPITRNTYYASRDLCSIMESAPRDRPTIMISYYGKKALLREVVLTIIKKLSK